MSEDPFDDIDPDAYRDREGDPFDSLETGDDAEDGTDTAPDDESGDSAPSVPDSGRGSGEAAADTGGEPDPFEYMDDGPAGDGRAGGDRTQDDERGAVDVAGDAFGEVDVSRGDPFEGADSAFQQVDVDSVDPDTVWDRFTEHAEADDPHEALGGEAVPEDAPDTVTVPKGRFCQTCPHFTAPPDIGCTHEGTDIVRFVDSDRVRVSNCPVVAERRELGERFE